MNHQNFIVSSIDYPEFITHIYSQNILKKCMGECENGILYRYPVKDSFFYVWDSSNWKIVTNLHDYNSAFNKNSGVTYTYGITTDDDVTWCPLGPEILDLEISVNGCPKVGGHNCRFCYKNNTDQAATNMTFDTFKRIIDNFPKSLYSVAFGITGTQTNSDFPKMLQYCRSIGVIPNYTLSGADLTDDIIKVTGDTCGAVAVSCYEGNKELCYNTIDRFAKQVPNVHINMHIVLSKGTLNHVMDVLKDLRKCRIINKEYRAGKFTFNRKIKVPEDPRLETLRHVVFLRIKPVGRAQNMDTEVDSSIFKQVIDYCKENHIGFGFDSCSAKDVENVLISQGDTKAPSYCQCCESANQSIYVSCDGKMIPCSFCETVYKTRAIDLVQIDDFTKTWLENDVLNEFRVKSKQSNGYCPMFNLSASK